MFDPAAIERAEWMNEFAQAPATLVFDTFVLGYFSCRPKADANGQYVSRAAYVDLNRANLFEIVGLSEQPIMALGGLGTFDEFGTYPTSVIRHGDEIRAYYGGWTRCASVPFDVAIGHAISRDGGVTFENGTVNKHVTKADFDSSGEFRFRFIMANGVSTSTCHTVNMSQGGTGL